MQGQSRRGSPHRRGCHCPWCQSHSCRDAQLSSDRHWVNLDAFSLCRRCSLCWLCTKISGAAEVPSMALEAVAFLLRRWLMRRPHGEAQDIVWRNRFYSMLELRGS